MLTIRPYGESDAESVGRLIADTFSRFNLSFASADELGKLLGALVQFLRLSSWRPELSLEGGKA